MKGGSRLVSARCDAEKTPLTEAGSEDGMGSRSVLGRMRKPGSNKDIFLINCPNSS